MTTRTPERVFAHLQQALLGAEQRVGRGEVRFAYGGLASAVQIALAEHHAVCTQCVDKEWPIHSGPSPVEHHGES